MLARRQFNDKFGPSSLGLLSTNMPAMRFNDRTTDKESNAQTGFFCREKRIKKLWSICGWNSRSGITDFDNHFVAGLPRADRQLANFRFRHGFHRVPTKVQQNLLRSEEHTSELKYLMH